MYPRVIVNLPHLRENVKTVSGLCAGHGISVTGVTKVFRGDPRIAQAFPRASMTCALVRACSLASSKPQKNSLRPGRREFSFLKSLFDKLLQAILPFKKFQKL